MNHARPFARGALALLAVIIGLLPTPAMACTLCSCTSSLTSLSFGAYDPVSPVPKDATSLVSVDCTGLVSLFGLIEVRASAGASGDKLQRTLVRAGSALRYNIYANSARSLVLADGLNGTVTITSPLNGLLFFSTSVPLYGRIQPRQWVSTGTYTDTVVISVEY